MSEKMFQRISDSVYLREFNREVERMNEMDKKNLELEYERLTGMECDDAAEIQTDEQFTQAMRQAYENLKRRRAKEDKIIEIYA